MYDGSTGRPAAVSYWKQNILDWADWRCYKDVIFEIETWIRLCNFTLGLILCSKREILWVESRDLSQTDNSYYGVFFSKVEWWVVELLFLFLSTTEAWTFCKMYPLNSLRFTFHQRNWDKRLLFNFVKIKFFNDKIYSFIK